MSSEGSWHFMYNVKDYNPGDITVNLSNGMLVVSTRNCLFISSSSFTLGYNRVYYFIVVWVHTYTYNYRFIYVHSSLLSLSFDETLHHYIVLLLPQVRGSHASCSNGSANARSFEDVRPLPRVVNNPRMEYTIEGDTLVVTIFSP